jgi:hypothetical protein
MLSDSVAHCILKIANNLNVSELQLSQLCFSMADATIQEERNKIFVTLSKLILLDREMSTKECEYLRTAALYLEINEKLWVQIMGNIHLNTSFSVLRTSPIFMMQQALPQELENLKNG